MSKENLEQFMNKVADSEELQAKIGEEIDAEALIALGAECGCEFTAEELQDSAAFRCVSAMAGHFTRKLHRSKTLYMYPPNQAPILPILIFIIIILSLYLL